MPNLTDTELEEVCGYSGCVTLKVYKRKHKRRTPYELHHDDYIIARFDTEEKARMAMDIYAKGASSMYGKNVDLSAENQKFFTELEALNGYYDMAMEENKKLREDGRNMKTDLQYFVDRVDAGTIRSVTTYTRYKKTLNIPR